ncbi:hypothetical protein [Brevibacillus sp. NRS-1366]|uniref:hypothetical protein n=1 Tax=Brevibacillus sp. NRS-1366 TaxID=3233899 RepID=UPI003D248967
MKWGAILALSLVVAFMVIYDRSRLKEGTRRTRMTFYVLTFTGWVIGLLLIHFPAMPGPSEVWLVIFKPLTNMFGLN